MVTRLLHNDLARENSSLGGVEGYPCIYTPYFPHNSHPLPLLCASALPRRTNPSIHTSHPPDADGQLHAPSTWPLPTPHTPPTLPVHPTLYPTCTPTPT